nr:MAG TPA: hypothetical protein [Bacteriophage sp.]
MYFHSINHNALLHSLAFFSNEKILFTTCCVLENCYYLCIGSFLVRGLDPTFRQS